MASKSLKDLLPETATLRQKLHNQLGGNHQKKTGLRRWIRKTIAQPMVWHLNRRSVAGGVAVGLFISWMPIPVQMLVAAVLSAILRVHVPVSMVMVWFTNPLTVGPILYAAWCSGSMILGEPALAEPLSFHPKSILSSAGQTWHIFLSGMVFCGLVSAVVGFISTLLLWRIHAIRRWKNRKTRPPPKDAGASPGL